MPRYRLRIEYDGTPFAGWQRQENGFSVQEALEVAALAFCGAVTPVFGAGRTDSGVHALGQVAHLDLARDFPPDVVRDALNFHLKPHPVTILAARRAGATFHARFSATGRTYMYRILNRRAPPTLDRHRAWWFRSALDAGAMAAAAPVLLGRHDFTTFRATGCQAGSPVRTLDRLTVRRCGDLVEIEAAARSFLHRQVRNIAGALVRVGQGRWNATDLGAALAARDRAAGAVTAPAAGLYLTGVAYPADPPPA